MALTRVQTFDYNSTSDGLPFTKTIAATSGNLLVAVVAASATLVSVTAGWTSVSAGAVANTELHMWYRVADGTESAFTVVPTGSPTVVFRVIEYSGNAASPFDVTASATPGAASTVTSGTTAATGQAIELAIAAWSTNSASRTLNSVSGTFARLLPQIDGLNCHLGMAEADLGTIGTQECTATWSGSVSGPSGMIVTFKQTAAVMNNVTVSVAETEAVAVTATATLPMSVTETETVAVTASPQRTAAIGVDAFGAMTGTVEILRAVTVSLTDTEAVALGVIQVLNLQATPVFETEVVDISAVVPSTDVAVSFTETEAVALLNPTRYGVQAAMTAFATIDITALAQILGAGVMLLFNPPIIVDIPPIDANEAALAYRLFRHYANRVEGLAVWLLPDDTVTTVQPYPLISVDEYNRGNTDFGPPTYKKVWYGGHVSPVTNEEYLILRDAGYAENLTP